MIENDKSNQLNDLFELIRAGNNKALESFLKEQPSCIHWRDDEDNTMLHVAAAAGNYEATVFLVGIGSDINAQRARSWGSAIELTNAPRIFRFLLEKGAFLGKSALGVRTSNDQPDWVDNTHKALFILQ